MTDGIFIDDAKRKKIVMFWIPFCLTFLHIWATALVIAAAYGTKTDMDGETIRTMFSSCTTGIGILIALLISDKTLEFVFTRITGGPLPATAGVVEKTTTETTKIIPAAPVATDAKDVNINAQGNVNVSGQ